MFMLDYKDYGWWYWAASCTTLWLAVSGFTHAYEIALIIGAVQLGHFILAERSVTAFPVQIRMGYLSVLLLAMPDGFDWVLWVPALGTLLRVVTGYCIMARMLMLMPFNRGHALSAAFIKYAFLAKPVRGNILHGLPVLKSVA
jgi:hypothetical protein